MFRLHRFRTILQTSTVLGSLAAGALLLALGQPELRPVIVQGADLAAVRSAVTGVGGRVSHELGIIHAVAAELSDPGVYSGPEEKVAVLSRRQGELAAEISTAEDRWLEAEAALEEALAADDVEEEQG